MDELNTMQENFDDCISLGVEKICDQCIDNYLSNMGGICLSAYYYHSLKYYDRHDIRTELIKSFVIYHPDYLYYITNIINKHFPDYIECLNKLLVLK
jgi:hypothetical protein